MPGHITSVGFISDTHGLLRPEAVRELRGCELIIHAGDVGRQNVLEGLRELAPVVAVKGNIDTEDWASTLPGTAVAEAGEARIWVLHDVNDLDLDPAAAGFNVVAYGHSHKPSQRVESGVLYINPGSAGPRRFRLPITLARLELSQPSWKVVFRDLETGRQLDL